MIRPFRFALLWSVSLTSALALPTASQSQDGGSSDAKAADAKAADTKASDTKGPDGKALPPSPDAAKEAARQAAKEKALREAARKRGEYTFDDLKFEIDKGGKFERSMLTKDILDIHKKTFRIRGYILPTSVFQQSGIKQFVLVRDNQECCFGPGAAIYDCILVEMEKGTTANFSTRPVAVKGRFEIDTESYRFPDGSLMAIYKMVASEVK